MRGTLPSATYLACIGTRKWQDFDFFCVDANLRRRYMFHQANMRVNDVPTTTVNGKRDRFSLLQTWVETVTAEMMRL
jgi:hypothetical protein